MYANADELAHAHPGVIGNLGRRLGPSGQCECTNAHTVHTRKSSEVIEVDVSIILCPEHRANFCFRDLTPRSIGPVRPQRLRFKGRSLPNNFAKLSADLIPNGPSRIYDPSGLRYTMSCPMGSRLNFIWRSSWICSLELFFSLKLFFDDYGT
jgi:hypothetical protein